MLSEYSGQTVVHEWTRLTWIKGTTDRPVPGSNNVYYEYGDCAKLYNVQNGEYVEFHADSYAVFASYHAYNQKLYAHPDGRPGFGCKDV